MDAPRLLLLAAAALFSTGGAVIKFVALSGWHVAALRSLVAGAVLVALLPAARRLADWRVWAVGAAYGATMLCFVLSNKLTTAANSIYLQSTAPLYLILLSPLLLGEPARRRDVRFMVALAAGLALFFLGAEPATRTATDPVLGNVVGALAGVSWAATVLGLRWLARGGVPHASESAVVAGNAVAFAIALPFAWPLAAPSAPDLAALGWLGGFQIALAYVCLVRGIRHVPALEASLLLLLEPVLSPLWAFLLHGELPGPMARAGCALILVATLLHARRR